MAPKPDNFRSILVSDTLYAVLITGDQMVFFPNGINPPKDSKASEKPESPPPSVSDS
jgi:hypothetical protein